ncbi:MAG: hypothetical protein V1903_05835 [Bacteroidota bacterium]
MSDFLHTGVYKITQNKHHGICIVKNFKFFRKYKCPEGDAYPNIIYIFSGRINLPVAEITLFEGEKARYFTEEEVPGIKFANILKMIVLDYIKHWGEPNQDKVL